jgi:hypothetical protein
VEVVCHISLKRSWRGLQLCFRPHFNQRSTQNIMGLQSCESLHFKKTKWYLGARSVARHKKYYKWEGGGFSQVWAIMSFKSMFAHGSSVHQKCFNYVLINVLFGLCKSMWIIYPLVTRPSPHPEALTHPSTPEVLRTKERTPILYPSIVVFTLDLQLSLLRSLGVHQCISYLSFFGINNGMEFMFSIFWTFLKFW